MACWTVGEVIWTWFELIEGRPQAPFPSGADVFFLAFPGGAGCALWLLPTGRADMSRTRMALDGVILSGSVFILSWVLVLSRVFAAGAATTEAVVVAVAYPTADVVLLVMAVVLVVRTRAGERVTFGLVAAARGCLILCVSTALEQNGAHEGDHDCGPQPKASGSFGPTRSSRRR